MKFGVDFGSNPYFVSIIFRENEESHFSELNMSRIFIKIRYTTVASTHKTFSPFLLERLRGKCGVIYQFLIDQGPFSRDPNRNSDSFY